MALAVPAFALQVMKTGVAVLVYALIVNAFYQVISKRRMFAAKADIEAEAEIEKAMKEAKESIEEVKELAKNGLSDEERRAAAADAAEETRHAVQEAEAEIRRQRARGFPFLREMRAVVLFPLVGFLFFILLSANLIFLGAEREPIEIFSLSMAILVAVRIAAYLSEPTSHDLAKLLPLALLGYYLVTGDKSTLRGAYDAVIELRHSWHVILNFFLLLTVIEVVLRGGFLISRALSWDAWMRKKTKRFR